MKKSIYRMPIALAAIICTSLTGGCFVFSESEAQRIEQMSDQEFGEFNNDVARLANIAGRRSAQLLSGNASALESVELIVTVLREATVDNNGAIVDTSAPNDILRSIIRRIDLGSQEDLSLILQDVYDLVEITVGQIRLGIDGVMSPRQVTLLVTILDAFQLGLLE